MSAHSSHDSQRESFQTLLSSAFAVQESGMDTQSLSVVVELRRLITTVESDFDTVMQLVADHARKISNATGAGIALLEAGQLVYRAASGSAAAYLGTHLMAVLSTSSHSAARNEIVHVENAQTDSRIEAAICRELGAMSLLMLPICRKSAVAGVLAILFSEPHTYAQAEVRAYRMVAGVIEDAIVGFDRKEAPAIQLASVPSLPEHDAASQIVHSGDDVKVLTMSTSLLNRMRLTAVATSRSLMRLLYSFAKTTSSNSLRRPLLDTVLWILVPLATVIVIVIAVNWFAYRPASPVHNSVQTKSTAATEVSVTAARRLPSPSGATKRGFPNSSFRRVRFNENEVDYVADDVTIRYFDRNAASRQLRVVTERNIGDDVTVRYFESKPAVLSQPASTGSIPAKAN
jgi:GAF domain